MIRMFSNGLSICKSGSPVMIQSAFPERASSRYISSFGSRQIFTLCVTGTVLITDPISKISSCLVSGFKYLSNFECEKIYLYSAKIFWELIIEWFAFALSHDFLVVPPLKIKALTSTLQSKITIIYFRSSSISFRICSSISGVRPFFSAWALRSSMISLRFLFLPTRISNVSAIVLFSAADIFSSFSAVGSLTSSVIVFIIQI